MYWAAECKLMPNQLEDFLLHLSQEPSANVPEPARTPDLIFLFIQRVGTQIVLLSLVFVYMLMLGWKLNRRGGGGVRTRAAPDWKKNSAASRISAAV